MLSKASERHYRFLPKSGSTFQRPGGGGKIYSVCQMP